MSINDAPNRKKWANGNSQHLANNQTIASMLDDALIVISYTALSSVTLESSLVAFCFRFRSEQWE